MTVVKENKRSVCLAASRQEQLNKNKTDIAADRQIICTDHLETGKNGMAEHVTKQTEVHIVIQNLEDKAAFICIHAM